MSQQENEAEKTFEMAVMYHQSDRLVEAAKLYEQILKQYPQFVQTYVHLSDVYVKQNKAGQALKLLEKALKFDPINASVLSALCSTYAQTGNIKQGLQYAREIVRVYPLMADAHYNLGNLLMRNQLNEEALKSYQKAIELNPRMAYAHYNLGNLLYQKERKEEAISAFEEAIKQAPELVPAYQNLANILTEYSRYEEAAPYLEKAIGLQQDNGSLHKDYGMILHATSQIDAAEKSYRKAHELMGDNVEILLLLGNVYRDLNKQDEALSAYKKVLQLDPENSTAIDNIDKLGEGKIAAWHFEMLADSKRNKAYDQALRNAISDGDIVLDIGTGSGLLAMMAARAGAQKVTACEMVPVLADVAKKVVIDNDYQEVISVINKKSTALSIGSDLEEKADVLVSEILDSGLLGEGVIPTHRHALANLVKPSAKVIPATSKVLGVLIECDHLMRVNPVKEIEGFDLSAFNSFRNQSEYIRVTLNSLEHKMLSPVFQVQEIDFKNLPPSASNEKPNMLEISVTCNQPGIVHGIAFWFDLHLDEHITVSSGPDGEMVHWGQALYFFEEARNVGAGDTLTIDVMQSDTLFRYALKD